MTTVAPSMGGVDPKRLSDLRSAASAFLDSHGGGVLVVDCVDLLTLHNGVERVVRTIEDLHDDATTKGGTLIVCVDPRITNPRLIAWLERELEDFPTVLSPSSAPDVLLA
ncbi:MAG: DUF835 domain-containing protein [Candidatus Thermoplasmatota archaeon]